MGCFDVGRILRKPVKDLWKYVGERAATEERFFAYFSGWDNGYAIEVQRPLRFSRPLFPEELKERVPSFTAPLSFLLVRPNGKLFDMIEQRRRDEMMPHRITLRDIDANERMLYQQLVKDEIAPKYDEITEDFAESILATHSLGFDPNGIFTKSKSVLAATTKRDGMVGFTTLTFKRGGSVKTGPTILLPQFRHRGYGYEVRRAIARRVQGQGVRKLYCTCPENDYSVIKYLLKAEYKVEAHLNAHYTTRHGELVFGKLLHTVPYTNSTMARRRIQVGYPVEITALHRAKFARFVMAMFSKTWVPVDLEMAKKIVDNGCDAEKRTYEEKPIKFVCVGVKSGCIGMVALVPKRGGAVKGLCFSSSNHVPTLDKLVEQTEGEAKKWRKRKLYFLHPIDDGLIVQVLKQRDYVTEGILREPYCPGRDVIVVSKHMC